MSTFTPAVTRLHQALGTNLTTCCEEINRIIHECSIKELESIFPTVLNSIFELSSVGGWGLRTTRLTNARVFDQVRYMLSPNGPIMELCYKLLSDPHIKFDYPLAYLPLSTRQLLEQGIVPPFYVGKLQYHSQLRVPASLSLNPFEFYMMHFTYYLVNPLLPSQQFSTSSSDILYLVVLEDYFKCFLPCNGSNLPSIPAPAQSVAPGTVTPVKPEPATPTSTLFKKSVLMPTNTNKQNSAVFTVDKASEQDIWRTQALLQSILENWLSHVSPKDRSPRAGSPPPKPIREPLFLPGLDHLRAVRMTIKHLHYFTNSAGPNIITGLDKLKRTVWSSFQKKLYLFMRHTMEHWPLDTSFRLFLETWLSYIQPWRYTVRNTDEARAVDPKFQHFIAENILFYTHFLYKIILRFLRLDLASPKDALMIFRVAKVYSQTNLKELIAAADAAVVEATPSRQSGSSQLGIMARQSIDDLEGPSFGYVSLSSTDFQVIVKQLLNSIIRARSTLQSQQQQEKETHKVGFFDLVKDFIYNVSLSEVDSVGEDLKKASSHLDLAANHLAQFFDMPIPEEIEAIRQIPATPQTPGPWVSRSAVSVSSFGETTLPPAPLHPANLKFRGNPDTATIRTYEIAALVRFFHRICTAINDKYGRDLELMYYRPDFTGRVMRQVLAPPVAYTETVKTTTSTVTSEVRLPPRLSLRFLAHKQLLGYILGFCIFCYALGWPFEISICFLIAGAAAFVLVRASLGPLFGLDPSFDDSAHLSSSE